MQQQQQFLINKADDFFEFFQMLAYKQFNNKYYSDAWEDAPHPVWVMGKVLDHIDEIMADASQDETLKKQTLIEAIFSAGKKFDIDTERMADKFIEDPHTMTRLL